MIQIFNSAYYLAMLFAIMYLFSSGRDYMIEAAKSAGRTHLEDKILMAFMASLALVGAAYPDLSNGFTLLFLLPLWIHLLRIAYLSYKNKHKNNG